MCDRRTVGLRQIVSRARVVRPVQTVPPEPSSLVRSGSHSSVQGRKEPLASEVDSSSPPVSANIKVRHVLTELLETERVYVNEISIVLKVKSEYMFTYLWLSHILNEIVSFPPLTGIQGSVDGSRSFSIWSLPSSSAVGGQDGCPVWQLARDLRLSRTNSPARFGEQSF